MPEQSELTADDLQNILQAILKNLLYGICKLQVRERFDAAVSALKDRFDDHTARASLQIQLRNQKQAPTQSVEDFCFSLRKTILRLNITNEF